MQYILKAEKLEVTFSVDSEFVEAILGMVRGAGSQTSDVKSVYRPVPEDEEGYDPSAEDDVFDEPEEASKESDDALYENVKVYDKWCSFVLMWLTNFDQEGEQPDRGEATRDLAHSRRAGQLVQLVQTLGGTTHAVHDVVESAFRSNESARLAGLDEAERRALARQVAENITQVSSIFFADLSDLLEYHNPLEDED